MKSLSTQLFIGLMGLVSVQSVYADGLVRVEQTVFGMDCAPCAYGLQKGLSKLPGATKVEVTLNDGKAVVEFTPNSTTTFSQVRDVILHGGFSPKEALVTVTGQLAADGTGLVLSGSGSERYKLIFVQPPETVGATPGATVTVQGVITAEQAGETAPTIKVEKVTQGGSKSP